MPLAAIASAVSRISLLLTSQAKWFQLFQPMGGVRASPFSSGAAGDGREGSGQIASGRASRASHRMEPPGTGAGLILAAGAPDGQARYVLFPHGRRRAAGAAGRGSHPLSEVVGECTASESRTCRSRAAHTISWEPIMATWASPC